MRTGCAPWLALALLGCGQPEVEACEEFLKGSLRSPSTYKRVKVDIYNEPIAPKKVVELGGKVWGNEKLTMRDVFVEYDAENAYGAPIRGVEQCGFIMRDGELPGRSALDAKVSKAQSTRSLQRVKESVGQADPGYQEPEYPCCL